MNPQFNRHVRRLRQRASVGVSESRFALQPILRTAARRPQDSRVVVSMTSHGPRLPSIGPAIRSLLMQSLRPHGVLLWVPAADMGKVPGSVLDTQRLGLRVLPLEHDYGAASKLLPTLQLEPESLIATADDDCVYDRDWLRDLVTAGDHFRGCIVFHRGHLMKFHSDGRPYLYQEWERQTRHVGPHPAHFFTGVGGVLYPPGSLHETVHDDALRSQLTPRSDDIWFNWMARLQGTAVARFDGSPIRYTPTAAARVAALEDTNVNQGMNDVQILAMTKRFGVKGFT